MDTKIDLTQIKIVGMSDEIMDELLRVPDNFENLMDNIIDDDETLPIMESSPLECKYTGIDKFED